MKSNTNFGHRLQFDKVASLYDKYRERYPEVILDDVIRSGRLTSNSHVLDVGGGTGQASFGLATRGVHVTMLEPGSSLAQRAKYNLSGFEHARVVEGFFEDFDAGTVRFDCLVSANAFHWIPAEQGYRKAFDVLKPDGLLALLWTFPVLDDKAAAIFDREVSAVDERLLLFTGNAWLGEDMLKGRQEMEDSGSFNQIEERYYNWKREISPADLCGLLSTYANFAQIDPVERERLFETLTNALEKELGRFPELNITGYLRTGRRLV